MSGSHIHWKNKEIIARSAQIIFLSQLASVQASKIESTHDIGMIKIPILKQPLELA